MISTSDSSARARLLLRVRLLQWARGPTFSRDIVLVLAFKLVLLMALKYTFFNHPQAENMSMPPVAVAQALLSVPMQPGTRPPGAHPSQRDPRHAN
ncbi:cytochrome oxidase putative small subunit CydP [Paraburkholderia sacchari]|uniref:cytochrome oxidase putative small subunit CydP n=1 Tax=Paraburkholderia sacchari TaxID=159450 RepID=UPI0005423014|nr:cytochrome oxidase putative small subunit CydP [Paraburkholderia sacchari]